MKTELKDIQHWMQTALINPGDEQNSTQVNIHINPVKRMQPKDRLAIYQLSYYARLIECMRNQFKALVYTLEDGLFEEFCRMYLSTFPSKHPSLSPLGDRFPQFLEDIRPDKDQPELWIDFMIAMAQFEVDLYRIFDQEGHEDKGYANEMLADEHLILQSCFSIHHYPFDVSTYYQEISKGNTPEITPQEKSYVAFARCNYQVFVHHINERQYQLLTHIIQEKSVKSGLEQFIKNYKLSPERVYEKWKAWKSDWIKKGFFTEHK